MTNKKKVAINYTNRDYESIRDDLTQIAERFYPDTFQDFSEGSFGAMMLDAVAYVGDQLSFYLPVWKRGATRSHSWLQEHR